MRERESKRIVVTCALPYSNGPIHLGHLVEHIQADIWVRSQKLANHKVNFFCADDSHGTAIMIAAEKNNLSIEQWIDINRKDHEEDLRIFGVDFDSYYTTHSEENQKLSEEIYTLLKDNGFISKKHIEQLYDKEKGIFLADRFVKGQCPNCKALDQYGDNCEVCSASYSSKELINPKSVYSGSIPIIKASEHYFFELDKFRDFLLEWLDSGHLQNEMSNKLKEWFNEPLHAWDITRDAPYFGFLIPGEDEKYLYVWLDAPIGYMASHLNWARKNNKESDFIDTWKANSDVELYHFIGKDIIYFHALFWVSILKGSNYRTPSAIFTHGFLTINGEKMSKSRGTFITAKDFCKAFDPELLRYYYSTKLNSNVEDIDLNLNDFINSVNSYLIGKVINIASRCGKLLERNCDNKLSITLDNTSLIDKFIELGSQIEDYYTSREYNKAMRQILELADLANEYISQKAPWVLAKDNLKLEQMQQVCSTAINLFRIIMIYLTPVIPKISQKAFNYLQDSFSSFDDRSRLLSDHKLIPYTPILNRISEDQLKNLK